MGSSCCACVLERCGGVLRLGWKTSTHRAGMGNCLPWRQKRQIVSMGQQTYATRRTLVSAYKFLIQIEIYYENQVSNHKQVILYNEVK